MEKKSNSLLLDFSEQIRAVEALLFASSDPLDERTLKEMLPEDVDINEILNLSLIHI